MADEKITTTGIAAHGASRLPSVEIAHPHQRHQISIARSSRPTQPPARSFTGGFRTTAPVQAASSRWAVIRNPSQERKSLEELGRTGSVLVSAPDGTSIHDRRRSSRTAIPASPPGWGQQQVLHLLLPELKLLGDAERWEHLAEAEIASHFKDATPLTRVTP